MKKDIKVLGIIPARGGSTSIKLKNIANVAGKPLIDYTIRAAKKSKLLDAFIVSTDSPKIAEIAKQCGADVPFLRPKHTARKFSAEVEYQQHALNWLEKHRGWRPELVVILRPTSPFRPGDLIDKVIKFTKNSSYSLVRTVSQAPAHPYRTWTMKGKTAELMALLPDFVPAAHFKKWGNDVPRQKLPKVYWANGAVDVTWTKNIKRGTKAVFAGPIGGVIINPSIVVDIDEPKDLVKMEQLLKEQKEI